MLAVWVHEVRPCLPQWMHDVLDKSHLGSIWYLVMVKFAVLSTLSIIQSGVKIILPSFVNGMRIFP